MEHCRDLRPAAAHKFLILGDPIAWARTGISQGRVFDKQKKEKLIWGIAIENQYESDRMLVGPLAMYMDFHFRIPKTHIKRKDELLGTPHHQDPDVDNCCKFIMDVCTGILYRDDNCVSIINCRKLWAEESRTEFTIMELTRE